MLQRHLACCKNPTLLYNLASRQLQEEQGGLHQLQRHFSNIRSLLLWQLQKRLRTAYKNALFSEEAGKKK